jgi:hypothetical protein
MELDAAETLGDAIGIEDFGDYTDADLYGGSPVE